MICTITDYIAILLLHRWKTCLHIYSCRIYEHVCATIAAHLPAMLFFSDMPTERTMLLRWFVLC